MNKQLFPFLLTLLMSMVGTKAFAYDIAVANNDGVTIYYNWINNNTELGVIKNDDLKYSGNVVIPESVEYNGKTYKVTCIIDFSCCSDLTSITIPSSVTWITEDAFEDCTSLSSVHISDLDAWLNVKVDVGSEYGVDCSSSPLYYAHHLYLNGEEVKSIEIPNTWTSIPWFYFQNWDFLTSITIPNSVTNIEDFAFDGCSGLTSITIPNSITSIEDFAFSGCSGLTSITIPNSVTNIGSYAFDGCSGLRTIVSEIENPFAIDVNTFSSYSTATLLVPPGKKSVYQNTAGWKKFASIVECEAIGYEFDGYGFRFKVIKSNNVSVIQRDANYITGDIVIPNKVGDYIVTSIGDSAFDGCSDLTSVSLPSSLKSIESGAFYKCSALTSVNIPEGVTEIGLGAFSGCSSMLSLTIPSSVTSIGKYAFDKCTSLSRIVSEIQKPFTIDKTVFETYDDPYNVYSMATLVVPDGAKNAYKSATGWKNFTNVKELSEQKVRSIHVAKAGTLPDYISDVEKYKIEELTLSGELNGTDIRFIRDMAGTTYEIKEGSVEEILHFSFISTDGVLKSLDLSNVNIVSGGLCYLAEIDNSHGYDNEVPINTIDNSISKQMFYRTKLESIVIPNSVTSIDPSAFFGCANLTSIKVENNNLFDSRNDCNAIIETSSNTLVVGCMNTIIPDNVTSIGNYAFYGCSDITSITIPSSVMSIEDRAFSNCIGLTSFTIPNSVTNIGQYAFEYCSGLTSITIPNSVTSIGDGAFYRCSSIESISVESGNTYYDSRDNCNAIIEKLSSTLIYGFKTTIIPNSVTSIGEMAFWGCSDLTSINLPNSVTCIGSHAFWGCSGLTSIMIPNSVTSIGDYAFSNCSGLTNIVSEIETPFAINYDVFDYNTYSTATLIVPYGKKPDYQNTAYWKQFTNIVEASPKLCYNYIVKGRIAEVIKNPLGKYYGAIEIPEKVTYEGEEYTITKIANEAFSKCSDLTSVTIPSSVTSIGDKAFEYCSWLTSITIPNSVTTMGENVFQHCSRLSSITISNSMSSIGYGMFYYCSNLTSVTIPSSVTSIGGGAFSHCSNLPSITIPSSVTSIGSMAFYYCSALTSIEIPEKVKTIGIQAFEGCSGLTSITIPNSVTSIGSSAFSGCSELASVTIGNGIKTIGGSAFGNCTKLTDVCCMAENVPSTETSAFEGSYVEYTTLHVPSSALNAYKTTAPWSGFKEVVPLSGEQATKCATPTISYVDGKIKFSCETEGVEYVSELSTTDVGNRYTDEVNISGKITVKVYAKKSGLDNSDIATAELEVPAGLKGDLNNDGTVNVADHVELTNIIMGQ